MAIYGSPQTDEKLVKMMKEALELDNSGEYDKAITKVNEMISILEILENEVPQNHSDIVMLRSTMRDRKLYIKILEMKRKQVDFENRLDNLSFKVQKLDKTLNDKTAGR